MAHSGTYGEATKERIYQTVLERTLPLYVVMKVLRTDSGCPAQTDSCQRGGRWGLDGKGEGLRHMVMGKNKIKTNYK